MSHVSNTSDMFGALHETLTDEVEKQVENQRARDRHEFRYVQLIAPYDGESLPEKDAFYGVHCFDLSPQGFSFLTEEKPADTELVAALGKEPFIHVIAEVVRVSEKRESDGRYLVGCQFQRRLD